VIISSGGAAGKNGGKGDDIRVVVVAVEVMMCWMTGEGYYQLLSFLFMVAGRYK